jgi:non-ribosomal peptide synthetase component F
VDLFDRSTMDRLLESWATLLEGMVADDSQPIHALPLLSTRARQQILHAFNATAVPYPRDRCVHAVFEDHVRSAPDAVALIHETQSLTYRELNRRANIVAHRLIALGVKPEDRVAICADRSVEMVVGLLGVLKAGGGYVPLDPTYPRERLEYILEDSAPIAVLTQTSLKRDVPWLSTTSMPVLLLEYMKRPIRMSPIWARAIWRTSSTRRDRPDARRA